MKSVIAEFDITLLERVAPGKYNVVGTPPKFYKDLYPDLNAPWKTSSFLEFFMETAELFFKTHSEGDDIISSGLWQEDGISSEYALIAYAILKNGERAIIVRQLKEEFAERKNILQKARESLLIQRQLHMEASYDIVTKLYNKKTFLLAFSEAVKNAQIWVTPLSLLIINIDDFRIINNTYGIPAGDAALSELGAVMSSSVRSDNILARYGEDEFMLAIPKPIDQAVEIAENIREKIDAHKFRQPEHIHISVSIGCAAYKKGDDEQSLIDRAHQALDDAKKCGKNIFRKR
jgi:diguanylate cyclase (GGDEF)-like protein